jgi:hypothetical protein
VEDVSTFTVVYDRIATVLNTKLGISNEVLPETSDDIEIMETIAIWETGVAQKTNHQRLLPDPGTKRALSNVTLR